MDTWDLLWCSLHFYFCLKFFTVKNKHIVIKKAKVTIDL